MTRLRLEDVLGVWDGEVGTERCTVRIDRDGLRITGAAWKVPMELRGASVSERSGEVCFDGEVSTERVSVILRRRGARGLELGWLDGIYPFEAHLSGPAVVREYACGDNRLLSTARDCRKLWAQYGGLIADAVRNGLGNEDLDIPDDPAIGLVSHKRSERPEYFNAAHERMVVDRLNAAWRAIQRIREAAAHRIPRGRTAFDRLWCHLDNPAPYALVPEEMRDAEQIEYVSMVGVARWVSKEDLLERLRCLNELPRVRYVDLSANELTSTELAVVRFESLRALEGLNLSNNGLRELPVGLAGSATLHCLSLAHNELRGPPEVSAMKSLDWLDLRGNALSAEGCQALRIQKPRMDLYL